MPMYIFTEHCMGYIHSRAQTHASVKARLLFMVGKMTPGSSLKTPEDKPVLC